MDIIGQAVNRAAEAQLRALPEGVRALGKKHGVKLWCGSQVSVWQPEFGADAPARDVRGNFRADKKTCGTFCKECLKRGIRLHSSRGRFYISTAHTDADVKETLRVFEEVFSLMF